MQGQNAVITLETSNKLNEFVDIMADPEHGGLTHEEIGRRFGLSRQYVTEVASRPKIAELIAEKRNQIMTAELRQADRALLKSLHDNSINIKAVELMYKRWDKDYLKKYQNNQLNNVSFNITQADGSS